MRMESKILTTSAITTAVDERPPAATAAANTASSIWQAFCTAACIKRSADGSRREQRF